MSYLIPGMSNVEKTIKKAYWDLIFQELKENNYSTIISNISELKSMLINLIPNRKDLHKQFDEYIDIEFLKQKFEYKLFDSKEFINLFNYIMEWLIKLGSKADEDELRLFQELVIKLVEQEGYLFVLPYTFDSLHLQCSKYLEITNKIRTNSPIK